MSIIRQIFVAGGLCLGTSAHGEVAVDFETDDGVCDAQEYEQISAFPQSGSSVTTRVERIKEGSLLAFPMTDAEMPAFTPVKCFAENDSLVLILSEQGGTNYCGWVPRASLLRLSDPTGPSSQSGDPNVFAQDGQVCPAVQPMSVNQYCTRLDALGEAEALCDDIRQEDGALAQNPIEAKFLTWNIETAGTDEGTSVPLFSEPSPDARMEDDLSVFTIMRIWGTDVVDGVQYNLVGPNQNSVVGWVQATSGTVWFSKLTTFFASLNDAPVLTGEPGTSGADVLADRPPNLAEMLERDEDFDKFPVLVDKRDANAREGTRQEPHLKIAMIGATCQDGQICADEDGDKVTERIKLLENVDILFLIDGTKSMREYYGIVADAVKEITDERASTTTRFGVAMYGDFLSLGDTSVDGPMQIKFPIQLTQLFAGDEFDELATEPLYIDDPVGGKPEAAFAGLYQAISQADWRDGSVRFAVHIADHGDRSNAGAEVVDLLKEMDIFYMPIAVRGEYIADFNNQFVVQTQDLSFRHKLGDLPMGLPPQLTFKGGEAQSDDAAKRSILSSLRGATELSDIITADVTSELIGRRRGSVAASNRYPAGFAALTGAARTLYGLDEAEIETSIEKRILAAPGYIGVPEDARSEDWDFQVALAPTQVGVLKENFDLLCTSLDDGDAQSTLTAALRVIIEVLTGDVLSDDNTRFYAYFDERENIPLVARTILGEGLLELGSDLRSFGGDAKERVWTYKKEACRTAKLLSLMDEDRRVSYPFEADVVGADGDLIWDEADRSYNDLQSSPFTWTQIGLYNVQTIYLPLDYLPRPYSELN